MNRLYIVHVREPVDNEAGFYLTQRYCSAPDARQAVKWCSLAPERVHAVVIDGTGEHVPEVDWK